MKRHSWRFITFAAVAAAALNSAIAKPVPDNLGNGLDKLVESNLILQGKLPAPPADKSAKPDGQITIGRKSVSTYNGYATRQAANYAAHAITDPVSKQFMVDIHLSGTVPISDLEKSLTTKFASLKITAVDTKYRGVGVIEGYISVNDLVALSQADGVISVQLSLKPYHSSQLGRLGMPATAPATPSPLVLVGTTFDQGVTQHRVDKINQIYNPSASSNWDGTGMTIGCISDSFNTSGTGSASTDVGTKDLPGPGNSINAQPVVVLQDFPGGTDEGRGMCQIAYKMAPRARVGFATADNGEVSFANNIRALAGLPGFTYPAATQQGFKADAICDDVGYFDEPYFQTGVIGEGINDVYAAGVSYFSSAGNDIGINGYDSDLRIVPNGSGLTMLTNTALKNTNINLANVPTNLYAGGFHNFDPSGDPNKQDVAQTVNVPSSAVLAQFLLLDYFLVFQWDDPYDGTIPTLGPTLWTNSGSINGTTSMSVTFNGSSTPPLPPFTAGQEYVITEHATSGNFDAIIKVIDPSGNTIIDQDTGVDETVYFFPQVSGQYSIEVDAFSSGPGMGTTGTFSIALNTANGQQRVTTDLNLLVFDMAGNYVASKSLTANNLASNQPIELEAIMGDNSTQLQFVIARANAPTAPHPASHIRWVMPGNGIPNLGPAEYFTYGSPTTGGHAIAAGCNGTAAYSVFRPSIPEYFTSPGPATIYFDDNNNRLTPPLIRQQPSVAAADGGNTSFFGGDSDSDIDTNPNFFGTSAAGPHAAAIAALVLQAHGGPGSVTPAQMTAILHNTAFPHDLDPLKATGTATTTGGGTVTVTIHSDNEANGGVLSGEEIVPPPTNLGPTGTGENDPNSITVSYTGSGSVSTLTFNPNGLATEGGNVTGGNNGVDATNTYFSNVFPGVVFLPASVPFTVGTSLPNSLAVSDVIATPSNPAPAPSNPGSAFWTLGLQFPTGNFTSGKFLHFTIGRGEQHSSVVQDPNTGMATAGTTIDDATGDLWGGGVLIPEGTITTGGMKFSGTTSDGSTFSGTMANQIGHGYSPIDGYGFINAEAAVNAALPAVQLTNVVSRKIHGGTATFDINLPLTGNPGIECRSGGSNGTFTMVFNFASPLTRVSSASVTSGSGSVVSSSIGTDAHQYFVNLTGVTNAQFITVTLANLSDAAGDFSPSVAATMGVLLADVDASKRVDSTDVFDVRQDSLQNVNASNFRMDVDESGRVDSNDVFITRQQSLTSLP